MKTESRIGIGLAPRDDTLAKRILVAINRKYYASEQIGVTIVGELFTVSETLPVNVQHEVLGFIDGFKEALQS